VFKGKHHSVYISAWVEFSIQSDGAVEIALPSAPSELSIEPYDITPAQVASGMYSAAHGILVQETPGDITLIDKKTVRAEVERNRFQGVVTAQRYLFVECVRKIRSRRRGPGGLYRGGICRCQYRTDQPVFARCMPVYQSRNGSAGIKQVCVRKDT
jgi:hypothetical protein